MKRKPIAITAIPSADKNCVGLWALCNDGTIFLKMYDGDVSEWEKLDDIPQGNLSKQQECQHKDSICKNGKLFCKICKKYLSISCKYLFSERHEMIPDLIAPKEEWLMHHVSCEDNIACEEKIKEIQIRGG